MLRIDTWVWYFQRELRKRSKHLRRRESWPSCSYRGCSEETWCCCRWLRKRTKSTRCSASAMSILHAEGTRLNPHRKDSGLDCRTILTFLVKTKWRRMKEVINDNTHLENILELVHFFFFGELEISDLFLYIPILCRPELSLFRCICISKLLYLALRLVLLHGQRTKIDWILIFLSLLSESTLRILAVFSIWAWVWSCMLRTVWIWLSGTITFTTLFHEVLIWSFSFGWILWHVLRLFIILLF